MKQVELNCLLGIWWGASTTVNPGISKRVGHQIHSKGNVNLLFGPIFSQKLQENEQFLGHGFT